MLFCTGFSLPLVIVATSFSYFFSFHQILTYWNSLKLGNLKDQFLRVSNFHVYRLISFFFEDSLAPTFDIWALGLWLSALAWMANHKNETSFQPHRYLVTSAVWIVLYLLPIVSLEYFPTRYKVHILVPMALFTTVGISLLQRIGIQKVREWFADAQGFSRFLSAAAVSFPAAVFLSPLVAAGLVFVGVGTEPLKIKFACVAFSTAIMAYFAHLSRHNERALAFFLLFPLLQGLAWSISSIFVDAHRFWPIDGSLPYVTLLSLLIAAISTFCAVSDNFVNPLPRIKSGGMITTVALCYLTISVIRIAPGYLQPHYSIRDASRDIGRLLSGSSGIATVKGEALFNENTLTYYSIWNRVAQTDQPNFLILVFRPEQNSDIVQREYHLLKTYALYVAPEYLRADPTYANKPLTASVYKKNQSNDGNNRQTRLP